MYLKYINIKFLILLITLTVSCTSFANTTDVEKFRGCAGFTDVKWTDWICDDLVFAKNAKWINGYQSGNSLEREFRPNKAITRAELIKVFVVASGADEKKITEEYSKPHQSFPDINNDDWFKPYASYMKENQLIDGRVNQETKIREFRGNERITLSEAMKLALNVYRIKYNLAPISDSDAKEQWFVDYFREFEKVGFTFNDYQKIIERRYGITSIEHQKFLKEEEELDKNPDARRVDALFMVYDTEITRSEALRLIVMSRDYYKVKYDVTACSVHSPDYYFSEMPVTCDQRKELFAYYKYSAPHLFQANNMLSGEISDLELYHDLIDLFISIIDTGLDIKGLKETCLSDPIKCDSIVDAISKQLTKGAQFMVDSYTSIYFNDDPVSKAINISISFTSNKGFNLDFSGCGSNEICNTVIWPTIESLMETLGALIDASYDVDLKLKFKSIQKYFFIKVVESINHVSFALAINSKTKKIYGNLLANNYSESYFRNKKNEIHWKALNFSINKRAWFNENLPEKVTRKEKIILLSEVLNYDSVDLDLALKATDTSIKYAEDKASSCLGINNCKP